MKDSEDFIERGRQIVERENNNIYKKLFRAWLDAWGSKSTKKFDDILQEQERQRTSGVEDEEEVRIIFWKKRKSKGGRY